MPTRSRASHSGGNGRSPRASRTSWPLIAAGVALIALAALMYLAVEAYRPAQAAPVEGRLEEVAPPAPQPTAEPTRPAPSEPRGEAAPQPRRPRRPTPRPNRRRPPEVTESSSRRPQPPKVAEPPTTKPPTGRIEISTNPGGYPVIIDGRPDGETTEYVRVIDLEPGAHTVEILFPNKTPWRQTFQMAAGRRYCIALNYRPTTISVPAVPTSPAPEQLAPAAAQVETVDLSDVTGTVCDCGETRAVSIGEDTEPDMEVPETPVRSSPRIGGMPPANPEPTPRLTPRRPGPPATTPPPPGPSATAPPATTPAVAAPTAPPAKEQDRIVARHPQRLLEDKDSTLSVELSRVLGDVIAHTAKEGENLVTIGRPGEIAGAADPEATISEAFGPRYKAFATVSLISDQLSIIEAPPPEQSLVPDKVAWGWRVRPREGIGEKARFAFQIDVVWKADGLPDIRRSAVWRKDCEAPVGLPAHIAALNYGSPASGLGGGGAMVGGFIQRRRRKLAGEEGDEGEGAAVAVEPAADDVRCTAFAPEQVAPGDVFQVQVFAHLAEQAGGLAALAAMADDAARDRGSAALSSPVERGGELTFRLQAPGLEVLEAEQTLVWQGRAEAPPCVQFAVVVPDDCKPKQTVGVVKIYYEKAPVGQLMFKLRVAEAGAPQPAPAPLAQREVRYRKAFISYCSKDRDKVARGLQGLKRGMKWAGMDYFMDMQDIESGERWREVIQKNLDESDLFILFWSAAAKSSEEVYKEIRYALARKGGSEENPPFFEPITIELPLPAPPPELNALHFNDELLYIITAEEALEARRGAPPS